MVTTPVYDGVIAEFSEEGRDINAILSRPKWDIEEAKKRLAPVKTSVPAKKTAKKQRGGLKPA